MRTTGKNEGCAKRKVNSVAGKLSEKIAEAGPTERMR
jgi:hypothetical protein